uniref:Uncharacterized protein n=1 Tax=Arundo donax TaxID=35708 RepID=A0A0A8XNA7_ARUDO
MTFGAHRGGILTASKVSNTGVFGDKVVCFFFAHLVLQLVKSCQSSKLLTLIQKP